MREIIKGLSGSSGEATGTARVIKTIQDATRLKKGDILITKVTSPIWTPFIHIAKAVVTDVGGALSHAAIVSREYGIPAVVGTGNATEVIKDGSKIKVDGDSGKIFIVER